MAVVVLDCGCIVRWEQGRVSVAQDECRIAALQTALIRYGRHEDRCKARTWVSTDDSPVGMFVIDPLKCTCGLRAVRLRIETKADDHARVDGSCAD